MATTITKLFPNGVLQSSVGLDEVNFNGVVKVGPDGVFAKEFNEIDLAAGTAERRLSDGTYLVSGYFDDYTLAPAAARAPGSPTVGTVTVLGTSSVSVAFTTPVDTGTSPITSYVATSIPDSVTGTAPSSPITVSGLRAARSYRFTVAAVSAAGTSPDSSQSNQVTTTVPTGQAIFTTATTGGSNYTTGPVGFTWVCPDGVTSVSVVAVGAGGPSYGTSLMAGGGGALAYANNVSVTPGTTYYIGVGYSLGGAFTNRRSYFSSGICEAQGGDSSITSSGNNYAGGVVYGTGGIGGPGGKGSGSSGGGGGGAGGYSGAPTGGGGIGQAPYYSTSAASGINGAGGGGGSGGDGGGVGIFGQGSNGSAGGGAGSGGSGAVYGGGAGAIYASASGTKRSGGGGAVRIIWPGTTRQFPSTNVGNF